MRRKDDEKEQRIRRSVITLMLKEGFNGTSIAKIAKMAGVSPATVYIYYENKEDMLQDIYLQYSDEVFDYLLAGIRCDMDGAQLIETLIEQKNSRPIHRRYSDKSVSAILFYPVKALAADHSSSEEEKAQLLEELIEMIQRAILA